MKHIIRRTGSLLGGVVLALALPAEAKERDGETVFRAVCFTCHETGQHGAPVVGDTKRWRPLLREGQKTLTRTAIKGIRKMPPRGGDPTLSDEEVARAVAYMANRSGGKFKEPD